MITTWDPVFPAYKLASNKGYRSPAHVAALREFGPSPLHRQSFAPVWNSAHPQEVLEFMLEEDEVEELAALESTEPDHSPKPEEGLEGVPVTADPSLRS